MPIADHDSPRRADAARNRATVLAAAIEALREHGPAASVEQIAQRAGLGVGTVIRSFGSKSKLLDSAIAALFAPVVTQAKLAVGVADVAESLRTTLLELAVLQHGNRALSAAPVEGEMPKTFALRKQLLVHMTALIDRAQSLGLVRHDLSVSDVAMLLAGLGHVASTPNCSPAQVRRYVIILVDGLRPAYATRLPWPRGR